MREAIDRGGMYRRRKLVDFGRSRGNPDRRRALRTGTSILHQAKIPELLGELQDILIEEGYTGHLSEKPFVHEYTGAIAYALDWIDEESNNRLIMVQAWPISKRLWIGGAVVEEMEEGKWHKPQTVADAIYQAYRNPLVNGVNEAAIPE